MKTVEIYEYAISGYYYADGEEMHFWEIVKAEDNSVAMDMVVGRIAREVSLEGKAFRLDCIHYDIW